MKTTKDNKKKITLRMVMKYFIKKSKPYKRLILLSIIGSIIVSLT